MIKIIRNYLAKAYGFTVFAADASDHFYTFTYSEAVKWAACYDRRHGAYIYKHGVWVAYKGTSTKPSVFKTARKAPKLDRAIATSL